MCSGFEGLGRKKILGREGNLVILIKKERTFSVFIFEEKRIRKLGKKERAFFLKRRKFRTLECTDIIGKFLMY